MLFFCFLQDKLHSLQPLPSVGHCIDEISNLTSMLKMLHLNIYIQHARVCNVGQLACKGSSQIHLHLCFNWLKFMMFKMEFCWCVSLFKILVALDLWKISFLLLFRFLQSRVSFDDLSHFLILSEITNFSWDQECCFIVFWSIELKHNL